MALPTNVNYGTVVGQFLLAYADSNDAGDQPDGIPAKGSIYFRPSPIKLLDGLSTPNPVTILPAVVECLLDSEGYLLGYPGDRGVRLVATDDPDLNPQNWTWTVEFRLTDQDDVPVPIPSFSIALPQDTTVDLTTVTPLPDANGTYYLVGPTGPANVLTIAGTMTLTPEENAFVFIDGTAPAQNLTFGIPQGRAATIEVGSTTTVTPETPASVTNSGTTAEAIFDFEIPQGLAATVNAGITTTVSPGTPASVTNSGTAGAAVFDFSIPEGIQGETGETGPQGIQGETGLTGATGPQGDAATIAVGTVTTVTPLEPATVTNVGTSGAAVFNFEIPKGETGELGSLSATSPVTYASNTIGLDYNALVIDGGTA